MFSNVRRSFFSALGVLGVLFCGTSFLVTEAEGASATIDLSGVTMTSAFQATSAQTIGISNSYDYAFVGSVRGNGELSGYLPAGTSFRTFLEKVHRGGGRFAKGQTGRDVLGYPFMSGPAIIGRLGATQCSLAFGVSAVNSRVLLVISSVFSNPRSMPDVTFENGSKFILGPHSDTVGTISMAAAELQVAENAGMVAVKALRTGSTAGLALVEVKTVPGSAKAGKDYTATSADLVFEDGQSEVVVRIPILNNSDDGPNRSFTVQLSNPQLSGVLGTVKKTVCTITDEEPTIRGVYNGVVSGTPRSAAGSGFVEFAISESGSYTGTLRLAGKRYALRGKFSAADGTTEPIPLATPNPLVFSPSLNTGTRVISGVFKEDSKTVALASAGVAPYSSKNPFDRPGRYAVLFAPPQLQAGQSAATIPQGTGYGFLTIKKTGAATISGVLCDGRKFSSGASMTVADAFALYVPVDTGSGAFVGSLALKEATAANDVEGVVSWIKPANAKAGIFKTGFSVTLTSSGSIFTVPRRDESFTSAEEASVTVQHGNLNSAFVNTLKIDSRGRVAVDSPVLNRLSLSVSRSTGLMTGSFQITGSSVKQVFSGAFLQKQARGAGFFIGIPAQEAEIQSGSVVVTGQ
jgi:hypothetical protein